MISAREPIYERGLIKGMIWKIKCYYLFIIYFNRGNNWFVPKCLVIKEVIQFHGHNFARIPQFIISSEPCHNNIQITCCFPLSVIFFNEFTYAAWYEKWDVMICLSHTSTEEITELYLYHRDIKQEMYCFKKQIQ